MSPPETSSRHVCGWRWFQNVFMQEYLVLSWTRSGWIQFCRSPEEFGEEIAELVEAISELDSEK